MLLFKISWKEIGAAYYHYCGWSNLRRGRHSVDSAWTTFYENKVVLLKLIARFGVEFVDLIT